MHAISLRSALRPPSQETFDDPIYKELHPDRGNSSMLVGLLVPQVSSFAAEQNVGESEKIKDLLRKRAATAKELYEIVRISKSER